MRRFAALLLAALVVAAALPGRAAPAHANGVPQLVKLTYVEGISNWGPKDAEGVLEFSFAEAYAKVDVKNLKAEPGFTLDGWLTGPSGESLYVGAIPVDASGLGQFEGVLANLESYDYNTFVVAARPAGTILSENIPATKSIAGRFTVIGNDGQAQTGGDLRPQLLPDTGEKPESVFEANLGRILYVVAVMAVATGVSMTIRRIQRRRSA